MEEDIGKFERAPGEGFACVAAPISAPIMLLQNVSTAFLPSPRSGFVTQNAFTLVSSSLDKTISFKEFELLEKRSSPGPRVCDPQQCGKLKSPQGFNTPNSFAACCGSQTRGPGNRTQPDFALHSHPRFTYPRALMTKLKIASLAGDGIGPEVMREAIKVLRAVEVKFSVQIEVNQAAVGWAGIDAAGKALPDDTLGLCQNSDAILFGSVGL